MSDYTYSTVDAVPADDAARATLKCGEWPAKLTALDGLIDLEFWGWNAQHPDKAEYRDRFHEVVDVWRMADGRLVADVRED